MKKFTTILLIGLICFGLVGCGSKKKNDSSSSDNKLETKLSCQDITAKTRIDDPTVIYYANGETMATISGTSPSETQLDERARFAVNMIVNDVIAKTGCNPYQVAMHIDSTIDKKTQLLMGDIFSGKYMPYQWENDKVQAGVAIVNVETGALTAIGGNRNTNNDLNYAIDINNPVGSLAMPLFAYAPAIEFLNWTSDTLLEDEPMTTSKGQKIMNWDAKYMGSNTIQFHLTNRRNVPAVKAFNAVGIKDVRKFATSLGLQPEESLDERYAMGTYNGETPLSIAASYSAFANGGSFTSPYTFTKAMLDETLETYNNEIVKKRVMRESTANIMTNMLQDTQSKYAMMTGTTTFDSESRQKYNLPGNAVKDLWAVGYDKSLSIGIWYGYSSPENGYNIQGSNMALKLFQAVTSTLSITEKTVVIED